MTVRLARLRVRASGPAGLKGAAQVDSRLVDLNRDGLRQGNHVVGIMKAKTCLYEVHVTSVPTVATPGINLIHKVWLQYVLYLKKTL